LGSERIVHCLGKRAAVAQELAEASQHESRDGLPVIDMPWRQPKGEAFAFIVIRFHRYKLDFIQLLSEQRQ
jgi:hypothetical protein